MTCRHARMWLFGGLMAWCPDCGGIRAMQAVEGGNAVEPRWKRWIKPVGWKAATKALEREAVR